MAGHFGLADTANWFQNLFGFAESEGYMETKAQLSYADGMLTSKANGKSYKVGVFDCASLEELRAQGEAAVRDGQAVGGGVRMENVLGDVSTYIANNPMAVVQAASQFNCLEFPSPNHTPLDGVTGYVFDRCNNTLQS